MAEGVFFTGPDGKPVFVPKDQVQEAAANPDLTLDEGQTVSFVSPNTGRTITTSAEDYIDINLVAPDDQILGDEHAVRSAEADRREEVYGGALGQFVAGSAGVLRGASAGLSDVVGTALGNREELEAVREQNPGISTGTEILGAVAPAVATGGTGLGAKIASKTVAGQLAKQSAKMGAAVGGLKGAIVAGGAEGAAYGAGQGLSDLVIKDEDLTAEAVFSEVGMGALIGGVAGGALGGVAEGLVKGASLKRLDITSDDAKSIILNVNHSAKSIDDASFVIFSDLENAASRKSTEVFDSATARNYDSAMVRHFDEVEKHIDNIESGLAKGDVVAPGPNGTVAMKRGAAGGGSKKLLETAKKSREEFAEFAGRKGALTKEGSIKWDDLRSIKGGDLRKAEKLFTKYQDDVRKMSKEAGYNTLDTNKVALFDNLADVKVIKKTSAEATAGAKEALDQARAARAKFKKALGSRYADKIDFEKIVSKDPAEALSIMKTFDEYSRSLSTAAKIADGGVGGSSKALAQAEEEISKLTLRVVGKDGKVPELAEVAILFGIEEAALPDFGPASDLLKLYAAYKMVKAVNGGKRRTTNWIRQSARTAGGRLVSKNQSSAAGVIKGRAGRAAAGAVFDFIAGGTGKLTSAAANASYRINSAMARTLHAGSKVARRSAPAATAILNGVSFAGREPGEKLSKQDAFKARSAELSAQVANLPGLQQRVHDSAASVRQVNLGVGDKLAGHAVRTAQFLHDKMPKDPGVLKTFGISTWRPTETDIDKWSRYINAAQDPAGVVERFSNGRMSREDAETLRTLYPGHFNQLQEWIADNLQEMQTGYSYDKRIQISSLMGVPADPVMSRVTVWQNSFAQPEQQSPQQMSIEGNNQETAAQMLQGVRE